MKTSSKVLIFIAIVAFIFLLVTIRNCNNGSGNQVVDFIVPEKSGTFNMPPIYTQKQGVKDSIVYRTRTIKNTDTIYKDSVVYTENPINKQLVKNFQNTKDSLERLKLYLKAIEEREGTSIFDNEDIRLSIYTKTRGELLDIKPEYIIKERKVSTTVPVKKPIFSMYAGGEVFSTGEFNNVGIKADIGLQNKSGHILTIGIDNNKNYYLGAKFRLFEIKK